MDEGGHWEGTHWDSDVPFCGYRRFRIMGPQWGIPEHSLVGSHRNAPWPPREPMVAKCLPYCPGTHCEDGPIAQSKHCKCGLHIFYTLEDALSYKFANGPRGFVLAMAAGGGRVLFDDRYARCEIADVLCIIDPLEYGELSGSYGRPSRLEWLREWSVGAAEKYGVPLLSHFDAIDFASEFGVFVSGVRGASDDPDAVVDGLDDS